MAFSIKSAVIKILRKVADPNGETYCNDIDTSYDGLAKDSFWESVFEIMQVMYSKPIKDEEKTNETINIRSMFTNDDIIGLITTSENQAIAATGKIALTSLTNYYKFIDIYSNPDGTTPLPLCTKKIDVEYFQGVKGADFVDEDTILYYNTGNSLTLFPKTQIANIETYKVDIIYVKQPNPTDWEGAVNDDADLCGLFSLPFIFKAIDMASAKINKEKEVV